MLDERPAEEGVPESEPSREAVLARERDQLLGAFPRGRRLAASPVEQARIVERTGQRVGMRRAAGDGQRLQAPRQGLIRVAEQPQRLRDLGEAEDLRMAAGDDGLEARLLRRVEGETLLEMRPGELELADVEPRRAERQV